MRLIKDNVERIANDEAQIGKLKADGYKDMELNSNVEEKAMEQKPVSDMQVDELKTFAKEKGIKGAGSLTKDELISVLKDVI